MKHPLSSICEESVVFIRQYNANIYLVWRQSSDADVCREGAKAFVGMDRAREYAEKIADRAGIEVIGEGTK
jgi:hypothetical protein